MRLSKLKRLQEKVKAYQLELEKINDKGCQSGKTETTSVYILWRMVYRNKYQEMILKHNRSEMLRRMRNGRNV